MVHARGRGIPQSARNGAWRLGHQIRLRADHPACVRVAEAAEDPAETAHAASSSAADRPETTAARGLIPEPPCFRVALSPARLRHLVATAARAGRVLHGPGAVPGERGPPDAYRAAVRPPVAPRGVGARRGGLARGDGDGRVYRLRTRAAPGVADRAVPGIRASGSRADP